VIARVTCYREQDRHYETHDKTSEHVEHFCSPAKMVILKTVGDYLHTVTSYLPNMMI
jgi:hypothetical protein